ncbi:glycosyltransferase family 2 protein [Microbacterium sp. YJN-G]|uniref:glycosyltransferase family 2 protein n=1 Tax=Microbacterium sp. YJN-G TaxID=2763257 RepID=UPI001877814D|nr:glycosyltransferase family 2 protein [Microbacterium sp. YJN-G]
MSAPASIDVILPYYGDHPQLRDAVRSVIAQTDTDWRLICVDDAHPDSDASAWIASLADPRIQHVRNETNLGVAGNFARCLELATAPWVTIMGSDDRMRPSHLTEFRKAIEASDGVDIVQGGVVVISDDGRRSYPLADRVKSILRPRAHASGRLLSSRELATSLTRADWAYFPSLIWRTARVQRLGFREEYEIALDLGLLLDVAIDGGVMLLHDATTFEYRRHRASASMSSARSGLRFAQERRFFLDYAERFSAIGWMRAARIARWHLVSRLNALTEIPGAVLSGDLTAVSRLLVHVFRP